MRLKNFLNFRWLSILTGSVTLLGAVTTVFSPVMGQITLNPSAQQLLSPQLDNNQETTKGLNANESNNFSKLSKFESASNTKQDLMSANTSSKDAIQWQPDPSSQKRIDAAEPGSILIFVQQDGDEAPRLVSTSGVAEGVAVKALVAQGGVPAALGCLMNINTPQNNPPGSLTHRGVITCTNTTNYIRGTVCPEFSGNGQWIRQDAVCASGKTVFRSGLTVERINPCWNNVRYRTWGEVRADFINQTDTDSGVSNTQFCRF